MLARTRTVRLTTLPWVLTLDVTDRAKGRAVTT
jgi:hypothetical protein